MSLELAERIAELDSLAGERRTLHRDPEFLVQCFVRVTSDRESRGTPDEELEVVSPDIADEIIATSAALRRMYEVAPWLDLGPAVRSVEQHWIKTPDPDWLRQRSTKPHPRDFDPPDSVVTMHDRLSRPMLCGLFTSTARADGVGMWRQLLEEWGPPTWSKPWLTWRLTFSKSTRIYQVTSARAWCELVLRHPLQDSSTPFVHPDWQSISKEFDAVHFTPAAVLAAEAVILTSELGPLRPVFWDVESTVWLRWCVEDATLIDVSE